MTVGENLGELELVKIEKKKYWVHDDWYCKYITVKTPSGDYVEYPCFRWLVDNKEVVLRDGRGTCLSFGWSVTSVCLSAGLSVRPSPSVCYNVCLSLSLFVCPSVCASVSLSLSVCLSLVVAGRLAIYQFCSKCNVHLCSLCLPV